MLPVEEPVNEALGARAERRYRQGGHDRREHRDRQRVLLAAEPGRAHEEDREVDGRDPGHQRGEQDAALEQDLDIHEPVLHDRVGERERHQNHGHQGELHLRRGGHPAEVGDGVDQGEGEHPEAGAPHDPLQLLGDGYRGGVPVGVPEPAERRQRARRPEHRAQPVEQGLAAGDDRRPGAERREVEGQRPERETEQEKRKRVGPVQCAGPAIQEAAALREGERKVQEDRREEEHPDPVEPEEDRIEEVQLAGEGKRKREKPEQTECVEVSRRGDAAPERVHESAHPAGEETYQGQEQVERQVAAREGNHRERHAPALPLAHEHVAQPDARSRSVERGPDIGGGLHLGDRTRRPVRDRLQGVSDPDPGVVSGCPGFHPDRTDPPLLVAPEDTVVHHRRSQLPVGVRGHEREEQRRRRNREGRAGGAAVEDHRKLRREGNGRAGFSGHPPLLR